MDLKFIWLFNNKIIKLGIH